MIRHRVDIEEHRAGKMGGEIIVLGQRQHAGQLEAGIDDFHIGIVDMRRQPFGGDERVVGGGH